MLKEGAGASSVGFMLPEEGNWTDAVLILHNHGLRHYTLIDFQEVIKLSLHFFFNWILNLIQKKNSLLYIKCNYLYIVSSMFLLTLKMIIGKL